MNCVEMSKFNQERMKKIIKHYGLHWSGPGSITKGTKFEGMELEKMIYWDIQHLINSLDWLHIDFDLFPNIVGMCDESWYSEGHI
jgi:hypothetical protein